jgi:hypothetical protein
VVSRSHLDEYLDLIEREREARPSEAMLADEIVRLRAKEQHRNPVESSERRGRLRHGGADRVHLRLGDDVVDRSPPRRRRRVDHMSNGTALIILAAIFMPCLWAGELIGHIVRRGLR